MGRGASRSGTSSCSARPRARPASSRSGEAMPTRRSCSFCGNEIEPGTGKMFIRKDGTVFLFCSHKCQANMLKLGRVPRWTPWTQAFRRAAGRGAADEAGSVSEETPAPEALAVELLIETPTGKDIHSDLSDLIDKRL